MSQVTPALLARVRARNAVNRVANELQKEAIAAFTPLVGQKILKQDGELMKKYADLAPNVSVGTPGTSVQVWRPHSDYSLCWVARVCETVDGRSYYGEAYFYVGRLDKGVLIELHKADERRTDYSADEVVRLREECREAKEVAREAEGKLHPFGEYER